MDVKARLQSLMEERGWTIYRLAKEANVSWSTIRNMFKRNNDPSISTLESLCKGMGITLPQFFDENNDMGLTDEQRQLIEGWNKLNGNNKHLVSELINALNAKR